ncbi:MAG: SpoIID/LytB domain-containing protein [Bryobacterales bacterium]|nr:SpoIID/LytB domain-containing protein [Bryobacterales bacterium]
MTRAIRIAALLCLTAMALPAGEALEYRVRLFSRSVPDALEIAPSPGVAGVQLPRLRLGAGREAWLRSPLRLHVRGESVVLGTRYPSLFKQVEITGEFRIRVPDRPWGNLRGSLKVWVQDGELEVEAALPREEYVKAVLAGEGGGMRGTEALRALAVAIRSYAFANAGRHKSEGFDFCDTTHCQDLRLVERHAALDRAVEDTAYELLWHDGAPVPAYHHADSGGRTESAQAVWGAKAPPRMEGRVDPYSTVPAPLAWSARLSKSEIARALNAEGIAIHGEPAVAIRTRTRSGRAARLLVAGREIPASDFRFAIGRQLGWQRIRSDLYEVRDDDAFLRFDGKGSGHGVGLSQRGAVEMARQGADYRRILAFYFPGARTGVDAQGVRWRMLRTDRLRFLFAQGGEDPAFTALASAELARLEAETPYRLRHEWTIRVYSSVDLFRNSAGLGGDIAAAARGREIHLQPLATLRGQGSLRATIRHEFAHALILEEAQRPLPEWLHEAMARWLGGVVTHVGRRQPPRCAGVARFEDLERKIASGGGARREAALVADEFLRLAIRQLGRQTVLGWPRAGFPGHHKETLPGLLRQACQQ